MTRRRPARGFTLIEIMVVLTLTAIIAAIIMPNMMRARGKANLAACEENLKVYSSAVELYRNDNAGLLPMQQLLTGVGSQSSYIGGSPAQPLLARYLPSRVHRCPAASNTQAEGTYIYTVWNQGADFTYVVQCGGGNNHSAVGVPTGYPVWAGGPVNGLKTGLNEGP